ncbi:MAG: hypothetical protein U0V54_06605 [Saprospiraceae bacterium]
MILFLGACAKDSETTTITIVKDPTQYIISNSELVVNAEDENGNRVDVLSANFNDSLQMIAGQSFFYFKGQNVNKDNELLKVTDYLGHEHQFRIQSIENEVNYRKINLFINKQESSFFDNDPTLFFIGSHKLSLHSNNYSVDGTTPYNGRVKIRYNLFDTQNKNHLNCLPGGNTMWVDNSRKLIHFRLAFDFTLLSQDNKSIQLKSPAKLISNYANRGTLIYYNKESGLWEFVSNYQPENISQLPKPGTYAIADLQDACLLSGQWYNDDLPVQNGMLTFSSGDFGATIHTSNSGKWQLWVPKNSTLTVTMAGDCETLEEQIIVSGDDIQKLPRFNATGSSGRKILISGTFFDCDLDSMKSGFIELTSASNKKILLIQSGSFNQPFSLCKNEAYTCRFFDSNIQFSSSLWYLDKDEIHFGTLPMCEELKDDYMVFSVDNDQSYYSDISVDYSPTVLQISGKRQINDPGFKLSFEHQGLVETLSNEGGNIVWHDDQFGGYGIDVNCPSSSNCGFETITINYLNNQDDYIRGSFEGRFWSKILNINSAGYTRIKGEFQVKK